MSKKHSTYVILTWHDSCTEGSGPWIEKEEINLEPLLIASAGMLVKETSKLLCIACATYGDRIASIFEIPKSSIQKIKRIKFPFKYTI